MRQARELGDGKGQHRRVQIVAEAQVQGLQRAEMRPQHAQLMPLQTGLTHGQEMCRKAKETGGRVHVQFCNGRCAYLVSQAGYDKGQHH